MFKNINMNEKIINVLDRIKNNNKFNDYQSLVPFIEYTLQQKCNNSGVYPPIDNIDIPELNLDTPTKIFIIDNSNSKELLDIMVKYYLYIYKYVTRPSINNKSRVISLHDTIYNMMGGMPVKKGKVKKSILTHKQSISLRTNIKDAETIINIAHDNISELNKLSKSLKQEFTNAVRAKDKLNNQLNIIRDKEINIKNRIDIDINSDLLINDDNKKTIVSDILILKNKYDSLNTLLKEVSDNIKATNLSSSSKKRK